MKQLNTNTTFPIPMPPKRWNPEESRTLTAEELMISSEVKSKLPELKLDVDDLLTVLHNSPWRTYTYYYLFTFADVADPRDPGLMAALAAGVADVSILMEWKRPRVVGVTRGQLPQMPAGTPAFPPTIGPKMPRLTSHAHDRLIERHMTPGDARYVMKHGHWTNVEGHLHCAIIGPRRRSASGQRWKKLLGMLVIVCPFSNEVITAWWERPHPEETRRGPARRARRPSYSRQKRRDWMKFQ